MEMSSRWLWHCLVALLALAMGGLGLTACNEGEDEASMLVNCERGAPEEWNSCYDFSPKAMHCVLKKLRHSYAEGRYELAELPGWAITRERDGAPIIYDVRAKDAPFPPGDGTGRLILWAKRTKGVPSIDGDAVERCAVSMTEAEMREAEGGGEGTTEWDSGEVPTK